MTEVAPMHQTNESQRINRLSVPRDDDPKSDTPDKAKHGALKGQARLNQLRLLRVEVQELRNVLHRLSTGQPRWKPIGPTSHARVPRSTN